MNDPGAEQPSQMFLIWVKARPQHRNSVPYSFTYSVSVLWLFATRVVRRHPPAYSPYPRRLESLNICWCNYRRQHFLLSYFKTLSVGPAGVELSTSRMTARCLSNWAIGGRSQVYMRCTGVHEVCKGLHLVWACKNWRRWVWIWLPF